MIFTMIIARKESVFCKKHPITADWTDLDYTVVSKRMSSSLGVLPSSALSLLAEYLDFG